MKLLIEDIQDRFNSQLPFEKPLHALAQLVVEIDSSLSSEDKILSTSIEAVYCLLFLMQVFRFLSSLQKLAYHLKNFF